MKINQRAIADELNLSTATVSKSLRNSSEVRPETRAQVVELAARLGYRPTSSRLDKWKVDRAPKQGTSLGLFIQSDATVGSSEIPHANMVLAGMSEAGAAADVSITVHHVPLRDRDRIAEAASQPAAMRRGEVSGIVLTHFFPEHVVAQLSTQIPCVSISNHYPGLRVDCIDLDHASAMRQVLGHLFELGHRRIGFLCRWNSRSWAQSRFAGYVQSISRLGLRYDQSIADLDLDADTEDEAAVARILSLTRSGVTAWVTPSDALGYAWRRRLCMEGLRVPEDVSITGIDAVPSPDGESKLTSVRVPFQAMGMAAVRRLIDRLREPASPVRRVMMDCQFVQGESTGPVPR